MDLLKFFFYILAPWVPFLFRNSLNNFKVWPILLTSVIFILTFSLPLLLDYSFSNHFIFSIFFVLFLVSFSTIGWLLTPNKKFAFFASLINLPTILLFYFINWQTNPIDNGIRRNRVKILEVKSAFYSDIETSYMLGVLKIYHARKKVFGGLLVRKYELEAIKDNDTCLYKGFDGDRRKIIYWDKCSNKINEP